MSGAMLFGNINSEIKRNKVEALCPALSNFTFLHRLEGRTWFRKKKSKISCWSISKVGSPPRSSCRSRARRIFSPWSKCQFEPDFWGRGDPFLLCDQLNLASFVHLLSVSQVNNSFCAILIWSVKVALTNRLYFHFAPRHCLTAVNIDVICEGPGHTKADPRRLDRSMGHHVRRLVLLQHKHRSCLRVSPPSLSQLREIFCKIGRRRLCVCQYNLPSYVVLSLGF